MGMGVSENGGGDIFVVLKRAHLVYIPVRASYPILPSYHVSQDPSSSYHVHFAAVCAMKRRGGDKQCVAWRGTVELACAPKFTKELAKGFEFSVTGKPKRFSINL